MVGQALADTSDVTGFDETYINWPLLPGCAPSWPSMGSPGAKRRGPPVRTARPGQRSELFDAADALVASRAPLPPAEKREWLRQAHGMALDEVAAASKVRRGTVSGWESAKKSTEPRGPEREAYARLLKQLAELYSAPSTPERLTVTAAAPATFTGPGGPGGVESVHAPGPGCCGHDCMRKHSARPHPRPHPCLRARRSCRAGRAAFGPHRQDHTDLAPPDHPAGRHGHGQECIGGL